MNRALLVIDYVNDFIADDGRLTLGEQGQVIENQISTLVNDFGVNGDCIITCTDKHEEENIYDAERNIFPLHCYNEQGRALYGKVKEAVGNIDKSQLIKIDKYKYSSFFGTSLDLKLKERNIQEIHLVGVCSDICILHTAISAFNLGYKVVVYRNAVATFNSKEATEFTLNHIEKVLCGNVV